MSKVIQGIHIPLGLLWIFVIDIFIRNNKAEYCILCPFFFYLTSDGDVTK